MSWSGDVAISPRGVVHATEPGVHDGWNFHKITLCGITTELGQPAPGWGGRFASDAERPPSVDCRECLWVIDHLDQATGPTVAPVPWMPEEALRDIVEANRRAPGVDTA